MTVTLFLWLLQNSYNNNVGDVGGGVREEVGESARLWLGENEVTGALQVDNERITAAAVAAVFCPWPTQCGNSWPSPSSFSTLSGGYPYPC